MTGVVAVRREREETTHPEAASSAPRPRLRSLTVWPWLVVLAFTGCFHLYRGAPIDGVVYLLVALALALDASGVLPTVSRASSPAARPLVLIPAAALCGVVLVFAPRHSVADGIVVVAIGATVLALAWPDRSPASGTGAELDGRALRRSAVLWATASILGCLWELGAFFLGQSSPTAEYDFPPLSTLVGPLLDEPLGRAVLVTLWLLGGFALLRRGVRR